MDKAATQKDIAEKLGVSQGMVARVLANDPTMRASEATRSRIFEAARAMGYRPNLAAVSMRRSRFYQIGVVAALPFIHPQAWHYVEGINKGLIGRGYSMSLIRLMDIERGEALSSRAFQGHTLDGIIGVINIPPDLGPQIEELVPHSVWLNTDIWLEERCIRRDEQWAVRTIIGKMVERGYRRLIYLRRGEGGHYSHDVRLRAVREVSSVRGLETEEVVLEPAETPRAVGELLRSLDRATALLAVDGYAAQEIAHAALHLGLRPGIDFSMAALDDSLGDWRELSRVAFPRVEMGEAAADMIVRLTEGVDKPMASLLFQGEWVEGSTLPVGTPP